MDSIDYKGLTYPCRVVKDYMIGSDRLECVLLENNDRLDDEFAGYVSEELLENGSDEEILRVLDLLED